MKAIDYFLTAYDCMPTGDASIYRATCPFCHHPKRKFYFYFAIEAFKCYHCSTKGKLKTLVHNLHSDMANTIEFENNYVYRDIDITKNKPIVALPADFKYLRDNMTNLMAQQYVRYVLSRGFSIEDIIKYNFGYSPTMSYYLIFPIYGTNNQQIYYTSRYIGNDDREKTYNPPVTTGAYSIADCLYNLNRSLYLNTIYLVEGVFDCLSMLKVGYNAVASFGKSISETQEKLLVGYFDNIIVCYDGNAIDRTLAVADKLASYNNKHVFICRLPQGDADDPNDLLKNGTLITCGRKVEPYTPENKISGFLTKFKQNSLY